MRPDILLAALSIVLGAASCSAGGKINRAAKQNIYSQPDLRSAHIGISIYDTSAKRYLYRHEAASYFIPASNTKLMTCYAAMRYLGDSLPGLRYKARGDTIFLLATGDPTLLHPDFSNQPVITFLKGLDSTATIALNDYSFRERPWGSGWSWDDYTEDYMAERSGLPVYGNVIRFEGQAGSWKASPALKGTIIDSGGTDNSFLTKIDRDIATNRFTLFFNGTKDKKIDVPFCTKNDETNIGLLQDLTGRKIFKNNEPVSTGEEKQYRTIHSQPTDSLLKIMMHRSDNFFAEQSLLMVSNELLGVMDDEMVIDTLLKTDYLEMPQKPSWVDGSGLSRYNLFSPDDLVFVLNKMRTEFNWGRIVSILPTGGTGTLGTAYEGLAGKVYAKTGTLSNNAALSGYLITNKGKTLIFSILVGNHMSGGGAIRNSIAAFLTSIVEKY